MTLMVSVCLCSHVHAIPVTELWWYNHYIRCEGNAANKIYIFIQVLVWIIECVDSHAVLYAFIS
jgi:hypothetical protein